MEDTRELYGSPNSKWFSRKTQRQVSVGETASSVIRSHT